MIELYFTFFQMVLEYGDYPAMLIMAFLTSLVVFAAAVVAKLALGKVKPWYFSAFLVTEGYFLLAQVFLAFFYSTEIGILTFFEPATYTYLVFVLPMAMAYRKAMEKWPVLPWHFMVYGLSLLASLVFWYFAVFVFGIFALA
ncbi:MAG: hypothetical protein KAW41_04515 [Candidatus Diapherotrites archaeon]|nr:hypothetical protein [Candidatus Diapherotrites archaeon]